MELERVVNWLMVQVAWCKVNKSCSLAVMQSCSRAIFKNQPA
jgi:hypothetical protein